jgi:hypothetical protein
MAELKPMSAAEYAVHAQAKDSERPTVVRKMKSGSVFELRKPDLQRMVILGLIPQSLLDESVRAWEASGIKPKGTNTQAVNISEDVARKGLITMREVVKDACVMPPFNEITAKTFLKEDFDEIYLWAMGHEGVAAAEGARTFRKGRKGRTANRGADGSGLQPETFSTAEN